MGDFARVSITGTDKLKAKLAQISDDLRERTLRRVGNAAAQVFRDEASRLAPVFTGEVSEGHPPPGTLKNSIIVKRIVEKSGAFQQTYYITVRRGGKIDAYYALWVERGHYVKPKGMTKYRHRKARERGTTTAVFVPPQPFMRPAYMNVERAAMEAAQQKLAEEVASWTS